jgi:hypothetical protein
MKERQTIKGAIAFVLGQQAATNDASAGSGAR